MSGVLVNGVIIDNCVLLSITLNYVPNINFQFVIQMDLNGQFYTIMKYVSNLNTPNALQGNEL